MGTRRVLTRYDLHCLDCGRSDEVRSVPKRCVSRKCGSTNIFYENNERYCLEALFTKQVEGAPQYKEPDEARGLGYYPLHIPGEWNR